MVVRKNVRINTISQSPTPTTAGKGIKDIDDMMDFADKMSPLGNASADDCADYCVTLFSDLTRKVTMQTLFHDGGFSNMGMSLRAMNQYSKDLTPFEDEKRKSDLWIITSSFKSLLNDVNSIDKLHYGYTVVEFIFL